MECAKTSERALSAMSEPSYCTERTGCERPGIARVAPGLYATTGRPARAVQAREVSNI